MAKTMLVTVGGSPQPIITSIRTLDPDRVVFICSTGQKSSKTQVLGKGTPCEIKKGDGSIERLPNLPTVLKLGEKFNERDLLLVDPDDAADCYSKISDKIKEIQLSDDKIFADYTGGTKTMSVAVATAAMDYGVELYLTTSPRPDLNKVTGGEATEMVSTALINLERKIEQFLPIFLKQFNYPAAIELLNQLLVHLPLDAASRNRLRRLAGICRALDAWDQFRHKEAWEIVEKYMNDPIILKYGLYLKKILQSRANIDDAFETQFGIHGHGYEIVNDLVLNAERRAIQQRYDDALGRIYRALELFMQIYLFKRYSIKTGNLDLKLIPEKLRPTYERLRFSHNDNEIRLSLTQGYNLIKEFEDDPLKMVYQNHEQRIGNILQTRNLSLFAHGFKPITKNEYENLHYIAASFFTSAMEAACGSGVTFEFTQFPTNLS